MFEYTCGRCGRTYRAPQVASGYGTLGFWDGSGKFFAVIDAIGDELFEQVTAALAHHPAFPTVSERQRGQAVQWVVTRLSDPAPNGLPYDPEAKPACTYCGATSPIEWRSVEPPEIAELEIPSLRRTRWNSLPASRQQELLAEEVNNALSRV
jgi:hypothetical protein